MKKILQSRKVKKVANVSLWNLIKANNVSPDTKSIVPLHNYMHQAKTKTSSYSQQIPCIKG